MRNTLEINNLEAHFFLKNVRFLAVQFEHGLPGHWTSAVKRQGVRESMIIKDTAWHQFNTWKQAFDFANKFQGLITPSGLLEVFIIDLPGSTTFGELIEAVSNFSLYDEALLI